MKSSPTPENVLQSLSEILRERRQADPEQSYVAGLYREGLDAILRKVAEESAETLLAAKGEGRDALVHEVADLWFHSLVLLAHQGIAPEEITAELARRFGVSGLEEKASRGEGR